MNESASFFHALAPVLVANVLESQLREAPEFSDEPMEDRDWETKTHEHYGVAPYWGA